MELQKAIKKSTCQNHAYRVNEDGSLLFYNGNNKYSGFGNTGVHHTGKILSTNESNYNDWIPYFVKPEHIPDDQWFTYFKSYWEQHKDET